MGRQSFYILVILFMYTISDSPGDAHRYSRNGRLRKKQANQEPSKFERWFTQNLDHFNPNDERDWQQRYFVNDEFLDKDLRNVAFLEIGGEGEVYADWMTDGSWYTYAEEYRAVLFQLEHRYYGKSRPTKDLSTENLVHLTSQQALADLAFFIQAMNKKHELSPDVKWIVFGGSYAGSLAAWMRQLYPHLVHGAMSSSGPLLAQLDFPEYFEVVQEALLSIGDECASAVKEGTGQVDTLLKHMDGQRNLNKKFKLCDDIDRNIDNPSDVANFYEVLASNFAGVVQYSYGDLTVKWLCDIMTNKSIGPEVTRLAAVNDFLLKVNAETCLDYKYDRMIAELKNISWEAESAEGGRQWTYQTCTEFGFYQTSSYKPQIFGDKFELDFFIQQCEDIFGQKYNKTFLNKAIERTNILYGGLDIVVDNTVFVHGSLDPWHVLGITETRDEGAPVILIKDASHCPNYYDPSDNDTAQLKAARVQIQELIGTWLDL